MWTVVRVLPHTIACGFPVNDHTYIYVFVSFNAASLSVYSTGWEFIPNSLRSWLSHCEFLAVSEQAMYSASVMDMDTTSCLRELHITGIANSVTSDPLWDLEFSLLYEASAYSFIGTSFSSRNFGDSFVFKIKPSPFVEAKYCPSHCAVRRFYWFGLDVRLPSRFTCKEISA